MEDAAEKKYEKKIENLQNHISEMKTKIKSLEDKRIYYEREIFKLAGENENLKRKATKVPDDTRLIEENYRLRAVLAAINQLSETERRLTK